MRNEVKPWIHDDFPGWRANFEDVERAKENADFYEEAHAYLRLLGTPKGTDCGYLLGQHETELGKKFFHRTFVFGSNTSNDLSMGFHFESLKSSR